MEKLEDYTDEIMKDIQSGHTEMEYITMRYDGLGLDEDELSAFVEEQFFKHDKTETSEDVTKLIELFDELGAKGYIALHKGGYSSGEFFDVIDEVLDCIEYKPYGYIGYHEQDMRRAVPTGTLTLSFGAFADTEQTRDGGKSKAETGAWFKSLLEEKGFTVDWDGSADKKLEIPGFKYSMVFDDDEDYSYERAIFAFEELDN